MDLEKGETISLRLQDLQELLLLQLQDLQTQDLQLQFQDRFQLQN